MTTPLYPPQRPLSVGETLDLTFRIYRATVVRCLPVAALAVLASQLPMLYLLASGRDLKTSLFVTAHEPGYQVVYLISALLGVILNAAILLRQFKLSTGAEPGGEVAAMSRRLLALLGSSLLFCLALAGSCLPIALLLVVRVPQALVVVLGVGVFSYVFVSLSNWFAVLVTSGARPLASLSRSWDLTRGSFWRLTAIYTVALIILMVFYLLLGAASGFVVAVIAHGELAVITAVYAVVAVALGTFVVPFYASLQLAVFGDLTVRREGTDLEQRISATA